MNPLDFLSLREGVIGCRYGQIKHLISLVLVFFIIPNYLIRLCLISIKQIKSSIATSHQV